MKKIFSLLAIVIIAFLLSLNYNIFVFPNSFAPAGVDGIGTLIPYPWRIDKSPLGWQKVFYLNPIDYLLK